MLVVTTQVPCVSTVRRLLTQNGVQNYRVRSNPVVVTQAPMQACYAALAPYFLVEVAEDGLHVKRACTLREGMLVTGQDGSRYRIRMDDQDPGIVIMYTDSCSGCHELNEGYPMGPWQKGAYRGIGCHECGYHGVRRRREWIPVRVKNA